MTECENCVWYYEYESMCICDNCNGSDEEEDGGK